MKQHVFSLVLAAITVTSVGGCTKSDRSAPSRPTQGALSTAVRSVTPTSTPEEVTEARNQREAERMPSMAVVNGKLEVTADEFHDGAHASRTNTGWSVSWSDKSHHRSYIALADTAGRPTGGAAMVHQSIGAEEDVYAPDVLAVEGGFVMAWADPANNRVRWQRLDATRRPMGRATIIHEGLESPRSTRLLENGAEYALVVAMDHAVYFARVSRDGARVGDGILVAENVAVGRIESLQNSTTGVDVAWRDTAGAVHNAHIGRDGRLASVPAADRDTVATR